MSLRGRREVEPSGLSKAERVRAILVDDILAGRLLPGKKLVEEELAARLGCSRTPVREALRHLDAIGLIQFRPHHGAVVVTLDRRVMLDLFDALAELEAACAELASRALSPEDMARLRALPATAGALADLGRDETLLPILHRAAGNPVLAEMAQTVRSRLLPYWRLLTVGKADWAQAGAEAQQGVIAAIILGDGPRARAAVHALILTARHLAEAHIPLPQLP